MITGEKFDEDQFLRIKLDMAMQTAHDFSNGLIETNSQVWNLREQKYFKLAPSISFWPAQTDWVQVNRDKTDF